MQEKGGKRRGRRRNLQSSEPGGQLAEPSETAVFSQSHFSDTIQGWLAESALVHAFVRVNEGDTRRLYRFNPGKSGRDAADSKEFVSLLVLGASEHIVRFSVNNNVSVYDLFVSWVRDTTAGAFDLAARWKKKFVRDRILREAVTPDHARSLLAAEVAMHPPSTDPAVAKVLDRQTMAAMREAAPSTERTEAINASLGTGLRFISSSLDPAASGMAASGSIPLAVRSNPRPTISFSEQWHAVDVRMFPGGTLSALAECLKWDGISDDLALFKRYEPALMDNAIDKGLVPPHFTRAVLGRYISEQGISSRDTGDPFNLFKPEERGKRSSLSVKRRKKRSPPSTESSAKRVRMLDESELKIVRATVAKTLFPDSVATTPPSTAAESAPARAVPLAPTESTLDPLFNGALSVLGDGSDFDKRVVDSLLKEIPDLKRKLLEAAPSIPNAKSLYVAMITHGF